MGRVNVYSLSFPFESAEELRRVVEMLQSAQRGAVELTIELDGIQELSWVVELLKAAGNIKPLSVAVLMTPPKRQVIDMTKEQVYRALRELIEEKLQRGEPQFTVAELYGKVVGRMPKEGELDSIAARRIRKFVDELIEKVAKELNVAISEKYVYGLGGRRGRYKVYQFARVEGKDALYA